MRRDCRSSHRHGQRVDRESRTGHQAKGPRSSRELRQITTSGRDRHHPGQAFFTDFVISLEDDVNEIKRQLQGDVTSSDTIFQTISPTEVKLTRSRFPWFDARITHQDPDIVLDYAKGLGVAADPTLDRKTCHFAFHVADDDTLSIHESFGDNPAISTGPKTSPDIS